MATIKIEIVAGQTLTHTRTVSGADLTRFADALRFHKGQVLDGGSPVEVLRDQTDAEVFEAWARDIFQQAVGITRGTEETIADRAARAAAIDIELTE